MRATKKTKSAIDKIIAGLESGKTLSAICRDPEMPNRRKVYEWMANDPDLAARIARARDVGADAIVDSCLDIADNLTEDHQSRKLRIWIRMEMAKKINPKRYGERVDLNHSGSMNVTVNVGGTDDDNESDA